MATGFILCFEKQINVQDVLQKQPLLNPGNPKPRCLSKVEEGRAALGPGYVNAV